jgi:hypothetical protein
MLVWHFDKSRRFSVRSAYEICRDDLLRNKTRGCEQGGSSLLGKKLPKHRNWDTRQSCIHFVPLQHASEGVFICPNLRTLHKITILPLTRMFTPLFNYKGEVVIFLYFSLLIPFWSLFSQ